MKEIKESLKEIFNGIEIYPPFSQDPIKITNYIWNKSMKDFEVIYFLGNTKYVFHYNEQIASGIGVEFWNNPLEQLEKEVLYMKRIIERGIGAKEYYPFTDIE